MLGEWSDPSRVKEYLSREIPHRMVAESMLLEALPDRVDRLLDLGTGDGRLITLILSRHPNAQCVGLDASHSMLERATGRFEDHEAVELAFHDLDRRITSEGPFDAIVSGLAIHHLSDQRKRSIFAEIYTLLESDGVFANLDLVASASQRQHERFRRAIGRKLDDPSDRLAGLGEQLKWLEDSGFVEVDCQFKWLELALIIARRS